MKKILTILLLILGVGTIFADKKTPAADTPALFAVATLPQGVDEVYLGDSVIVTLTLYSTANFDRVDNQAGQKVPVIKKATVRRYRPGRRLSQDIAAYKGKRYYAVAAAQYAVTPSQLGEITFPAQKYDVVLSVQLRSRDPFGSFFPFGPVETRQFKKTCASEPLKIKVVKRPRKTIQELQQSGAAVM